MLIKIRRPWELKESSVTPEPHFRQRRKLLQAAAAAGVGAAMPAIARVAPPKQGRRLSNVRDSEWGRELEPTDFDDITSYNNFLELGAGKRAPARNADKLRTRPWSIRVNGACEKPGQIDIEDILRKIPQEERIYRFRCVEAWGMIVPWDGFSLGTLLKRFEPTSKARYVAFETLYDPEHLPGQRRNILDWPYREGLRMDEAMHPLTMLVTGVYGMELPAQNGAPLRLIVPWKYGFKSIKSIVGIYFVEKEPATTWAALQPEEYGFYANVNPEVDHPRWSQKYERRIGEGLFARKHKTLKFNGYAEEVAHLYKGMDLRKFY
ncbi:MAG: protein-methionine-sulfoxide reductase catalytic subunit MsrP [Gammaproteobacteria bacterium]|nr:MAG: protein-methionine-sulfoxide reductase catalytic subunit MsrP [Gammaproteobacteria bacterium]